MGSKAEALITAGVFVLWLIIGGTFLHWLAGRVNRRRKRRK